MRRIEKKQLVIYEKYIRDRQKSISGGVAHLPREKRWGTFSIGELFTFQQGKSKGNNHLMKGTNGISYLGATNRNNAVLDFVIPVPSMVQKGNCIAFIRNGEGSMGYAVYKREDFIATADITVGYSPHLNPYIGMFLTTVSDMVRGKYNFNYKRSDTRLKKELVKLPITEDGTPDWAYMETYMKHLEKKQLSEYMKYRKSVEEK